MRKWLAVAAAGLFVACDIPSDITVRAPCRAVSKFYSHTDPVTGVQVQDSVVATVDAASCPK